MNRKDICVKMSKLKIGGCVVLYNPELEVLENIKTYSNVVEELIIVDNSNEEAEFIKEFCCVSQIKYVFMNGNKGIAAALNKGIRILYDDGIDVVLTMDQDSKFPTDDADEIVKLILKNMDKYSILGLNFNRFVKDKKDAIIDVQHWITSGNFVSINDYIDVDGFNNNLFIDYVDFDFNNRLISAGKKIGVLEDYSLIHKIGNPIEINIFGRIFYAMNHSPIRYYYRYRNSLYLYLRDKRFYRKLFWKEIFVNIPKMLLYEPKKLEKLRMIFKGLNDGLNAKLGAFGS